VVLRLRLSHGLIGAYLEVATSPEPINPTDGADLFDQWNGTGGYSARIALGSATSWIDGVQYVDLTPSATNLGYIRTNGLMFGFNEANYPDESCIISVTVNPVLFDQYQFQPPDALLADTYGDPDLARPEHDAALVALLEDPLYPCNRTEPGGYLGATDLDGANLQTQGYSETAIDPLALAVLPSTNMTAEIAVADGTSWPDVTGSALRLWRTIYTRLGAYRALASGGRVKSAVQARHTLSVVAEPTMATLPDSQFWSDGGGNAGGCRLYDSSYQQTHNVGWDDDTPLIDILWDCLMNSRHDAMYRDIYPDDWYWLRMRFEGVWLTKIEAEMIETGWAGASYADLALWCMTMLGLFCGLSRNGNLLVWHPAVYRPSRRSYTLDLDNDATDGTFQIAENWLFSTKVTGTDGIAGEHDDPLALAVDDLAGEREAAARRLTINPVNKNGVCPVTIFDSEVCRKALLRQYLQRGGKCVKATGTVGKRGMLYDLGDLLTISTARSATQTCMITKIKPDPTGQKTYFEAVYFRNWPAAADGFAQGDAPIGLYRGCVAGTPAVANISRTCANRTWRTDALKLGDMVLVYPGSFYGDERLGSWEGSGWCDGDYDTNNLSVACDRDQFPATHINLEMSAFYGANWGAVPSVVVWEWANSDDEGLILIATQGGDDRIYYTLAYTTDVTDPLNAALYVDSTGPHLISPPSEGDYGERMTRFAIAVGATAASLNASGVADSITINAASGTDWTIKWRGRWDGAAYACIAQSFMSVSPGTWWDNVTGLILQNGQDFVG